MLDRQQSGRDFPRGGPRGGPPERCARRGAAGLPARPACSGCAPRPLPCAEPPARVHAGSHPGPPHPHPPHHTTTMTGARPLTTAWTHPSAQWPASAPTTSSAPAANAASGQAAAPPRSAAASGECCPASALRAPGSGRMGQWWPGVCAVHRQMHLHQCAACLPPPRASKQACQGGAPPTGPWRHILGLHCNSRHQGTWHAGGTLHGPACDLIVQGHSSTRSRTSACTRVLAPILRACCSWTAGASAPQSACPTVPSQAWPARASGLWPRSAPAAAACCPEGGRAGEGAWAEVWSLRATLLGGQLCAAAVQRRAVCCLHGARLRALRSTRRPVLPARRRAGEEARGRGAVGGGDEIQGQEPACRAVQHQGRQGGAHLRQVGARRAPRAMWAVGGLFGRRALCPAVCCLCCLLRCELKSSV